MSFFGLLRSTKAELCLALGFLLRHPALQIVFDGELQVGGHFDFEIAIERSIAE
jgi:hypothetical protein